jgi:hypothetical protein
VHLVPYAITLLGIDPKALSCTSKGVVKTKCPTTSVRFKVPMYVCELKFWHTFLSLDPALLQVNPIVKNLSIPLTYVCTHISVHKTIIEDNKYV